MKRLFRLVLVAVLFLAMLYIGGYNWEMFAASIELKNPIEVYRPLITRLSQDIPKVTLPTYMTQTEDFPIFTKAPDEGTSSNPSDSSSSDITITSSDNTDITVVTDSSSESAVTPSVSESASQTTVETVEEPSESTKEKYGIDANLGLKITIKDKTIDFNTTTSLEFVKWVVANYSTDAYVMITKEGEPIPDMTTPTSETDSTTTTDQALDIIKSQASETSVQAPETTPSETSAPSETNAPVDRSNVKYNDVLESLDDLDVLVGSITVVDELPDYDSLVASGAWEKYDRNLYEKPIKSYKYDGKRYNRNDYAWISSPYIISVEPFKYECPYTGQVILDDNSLDYDHIVPLKSTYLRGAVEWTNEQKNAYAYDQWVGVDVLNSANRSKSDKGPCNYLPDENVEDYCYSWLLICSYYDLEMTDEEVQICVDQIKDAFQDGEPVEHLGGHYSES